MRTCRRFTSRRLSKERYIQGYIREKGITDNVVKNIDINITSAAKPEDEEASISAFVDQSLKHTLNNQRNELADKLITSQITKAKSGLQVKLEVSLPNMQAVTFIIKGNADKLLTKYGAELNQKIEEQKQKLAADILRADLLHSIRNLKNAYLADKESLDYQLNIALAKNDLKRLTDSGTSESNSVSLKLAFFQGEEPGKLVDNQPQESNASKESSNIKNVESEITYLTEIRDQILLPAEKSGKISEGTKIVVPAGVNPASLFYAGFMDFMSLSGKMKDVLHPHGTEKVRKEMNKKIEEINLMIKQKTDARDVLMANVAKREKGENEPENNIKLKSAGISNGNFIFTYQNTGPPSGESDLKLYMPGASEMLKVVNGSANLSVNMLNVLYPALQLNPLHDHLSSDSGTLPNLDGSFNGTNQVTPSLAGYAASDVMDKNSTFHWNNNNNLLEQQITTNMTGQSDALGNRHFIQSSTFDQQNQPGSGFTTSKISARGAFLGDRLTYNTDIYSYKNEQYSANGTPMDVTTLKFMPKTTLKFSDTNTGTDINFGAYNAFNANSKYTLSSSQRITMSNNLVMAPWADWALLPAGNQAKDSFTGNYGLVARLYDFTTSLAMKTTPGKTEIANDNIKYFMQFREGWGDITVGAKNLVASRLNPGDANVPPDYNFLNPTNASTLNTVSLNTAREYYVNMKDSKLIGIGPNKGDLIFSYFDADQRLKLDYALYMPAASEALKAVNFGTDMSVKAAGQGQVWAGAMVNNIGLKYTQNINSFSGANKYTANGEVFVNPSKNIALSLGGGVKDGKQGTVSSGAEYNHPGKNLGDYSLQMKADPNGVSIGNSHTWGVSLGVLFHIIKEKNTGNGTAIETGRVMNPMDLSMQADVTPDVARKAQLLSQDNLMQQLLCIPPDFKFGSASPYMQNIEKNLYTLAKTINDNSGYFNAVQAQAEMKTKKEIVNKTEREYVKDVINASKEISDKTRRDEIISVLKRSLQNKPGYLAEYQSLDQFSVAKTEAETLKAKIERYRGRLLGTGDMDTKEINSYSALIAAGYTDKDIAQLLDAKIEVKRILESSPELQAELRRAGRHGSF